MIYQTQMMNSLLEHRGQIKQQSLALAITQGLLNLQAKF